MEYSIFYHGASAGTAQVERTGLFWRIDGHMDNPRLGLVRLYAVHGLRSVYLGIPAADGNLQMKLPISHLPQGLDSILAAKEPNGTWKPWAGELDGVSVDHALVDNGPVPGIAFPPENAIAFPEWLEEMSPMTMYGSDWLVLRLTADGKLPAIQIEGEQTNETDGFHIADIGMPHGDAADDDICGEWDADGLQEADCPNL